jgi:hypothetical protein
MKSMLWSFLAVILILMGAHAAAASPITYTFVGAEGTAGTNWTLVDTNGYLTVPSGNVIGLVQTATDLILVDPMTGPQDFGPLTNITFGSPPAEPAYYGLQMGSSSFTLATLFVLKADFTTPGTYELADPVEVQNNLAPDQGTLTITATPEPSSAALMLSGIGLGLMMMRRKGYKAGR